MNSRCPISQAAFTLIEMVVVMAIVGLMVGAVSVTIKNITNAELRSAASQTSNSLRFAFNRARMSGEYVRLALDLDKGMLWLEASEDRVSLGSDKDSNTTTDENKKRQAKKTKAMPLFPFGNPTDDKDGVEGEDEGIGFGIDTKTLMEEYERDLKPVERAKSFFKPIKGVGSQKIKLPKEVKIAQVATARLEDPIEEGIAYIYFFPQGMTEPAIVHLTNNDEKYYSVVLHPLTGRAKVYPCLYKIPDDFDVSDDKRNKRHASNPCED